MSSKRKEYHVDCHAAKVAKFFLMCESHINPDMRIKIPAVMMAKGYSNKESKNRMLQMQVCREVEKIRGLDPPRPSEAVAAAARALLTLSAPQTQRESLLQQLLPMLPLLQLNWLGDGNAAPFCGRKNLVKIRLFGGGVSHSQIASSGLNSLVRPVEIFKHTTINHQVAGLWLNRPGDGKVTTFCGRDNSMKIQCMRGGG
jgi:hypothetical protein